jgi:hypothetical protein
LQLLLVVTEWPRAFTAFSRVCGFGTIAVARSTYACEMKLQPCGATTVPGWSAVRVGNCVQADLRLEAFRLGGSGTPSLVVCSPKRDICAQAVSGRIVRDLLSSWNKTSASGSRTHQSLDAAGRSLWSRECGFVNVFPQAGQSTFPVGWFDVIEFVLPYGQEYIPEHGSTRDGVLHGWT